MKKSRTDVQAESAQQPEPLEFSGFQFEVTEDKIHLSYYRNDYYGSTYGDVFLDSCDVTELLDWLKKTGL